MLSILISLRQVNTSQRAATACRFAAFCCFSASIMLLSLAAPLSAQTVPTGFQEYFVLGYDQHVWDMCQRVATGEGAGAFSNGTNSVVSATASSDNQIIYYDQWEDGYEADILNPTDPSTLIIGDGNPANGDVCDFNGSACGTDIILTGDFVNFASDGGLGAGCTLASASPGTYTNLCSSVPVNPRCAVAGACTNDEFRFDGGDRLFSSGGPLSLVHPQDPLSPFIGGATEIISRQALQNAQSYSIPIGEDIFAGNNTTTEPFQYVDLNLVAFDDNTQVQVDSPGAGTVTFTLNQGEHWTSQGLIDTAPAPSLTINAGTKISTTGPIAGLIFTGGVGQFATRFYSLLPDLLHGTDYVITAPGDDPTPQGSRPLNLYIFNADPLNSITVTATDSVGTTSFNVPANSQVDYASVMGRFVPANSSVRMFSDRPFWGVSAYDHQSPANDWGHSWLSRKFVTATYTVSFAPGLNDPALNYPSCGPAPCDTLNRSPVFVSTTLDNTQIQIDFDNDGVFELVDTDGDDCPDDGALPVGCTPLGGSCTPPVNPCNIYQIDALESLRIYDWTDYDNTGTRVIANKPIALAYGQDTDQAIGGDPIQDTGYAVYPIDQRFLDPVLVLDKSVDVSTVPSTGGIATYTIAVETFDFGPISSLQIFDLLPTGVAASDYVPGSTLITYPDLTQDTTDPAGSVDAGTGLGRLDWTLSPDSLAANQTITVRYSVNIPSSGGTVRTLTNTANAVGTLGGSTFEPSDTATVVQTDTSITKAVDQTLIGADELLTYTMDVTLTSAETNAVVSDAIPTGTLFETGTITTTAPFVGTYSAAQNAVVWTAAAVPAGTYTLTFQVRTQPGIPRGDQIPNSAIYESDQVATFSSNEVISTVVGPELQVSKTGPSVGYPGQTMEFEILVENIGTGTANTVLIRDPFPLNATYVSESMEYRFNADPFISLSDANDGDAGTEQLTFLELQVPSLGPGEDLTFRFRALVTGVAGDFVTNQATVASSETTPKDTNLVQIPIVGTSTVTGNVFFDLDGDGTDNAGSDPGIANIDILVTDSTGNTQIVTTDSNGDWTATVAFACFEDDLSTVAYNNSTGALDWTTASYEWTEFSDQGDADTDPSTDNQAIVADPLGAFGNSLRIVGGPAASATGRGFTRAVDLSGFNSGTLSFDYRRSSMEAADTVDVEVDYDNDGTFNDVLTTLAGIGTDATWQSASFVLDVAQIPDNPVVFRWNGNNFNFSNDEFFLDNIRVCNTEVTINVDETDPDFPVAAMLTTANDPQTVVAVEGGSVASQDVGYAQAQLLFTKDSDTINDEASPGQRITYTMELTNNSGVTQTAVEVSDPVPTGTSYVAATAQLQAPLYRTTEYLVSFATDTFDLTLDQDLAPNYFVIVQGSDGDGGNTTTGPDENFLALTGDPFGTGDLATTADNTTLAFTRNNNNQGWNGVITVVESLADFDGSGFRLRSVEIVNHSGTTVGGTDTSAVSWTTLGQVMLMGGYNGAGCETAATSSFDHPSCFVRLFPSGSNTINWSRTFVATDLITANTTVMVVEWGSDWTVQNVNVGGAPANSGNGLDAVGEWTTAAISSVARDNTWVWGTGWSDDNGVGDSSEGVAITLGDGVNQNANETTIAIGVENSDTLDFQVWALTHPDVRVDYRVVADGAPGSAANPNNGEGNEDDLVENVTVDAPTDPINGKRFALVTNGAADTNTAYPRSSLYARYSTSTSVTITRNREGVEFPAFVQGVELPGVITTTANDPAGLIVPGDGYSLAPGESIILTFQVDVDDPLANAVTSIDNTATAQTALLGPENAMKSDTVVRVGVTVEPNNGSFATPGSTVTYSHEVVNTGEGNDAFDLTLTSELGYAVELIDPATGSVIATDSNGDGVWDGGVTINTGSLAPNDSVFYDVRVTIPGGAMVGDQDTTRLTATSNRNSMVSDVAIDETIIVDPADVGDVVLVSDQSGVIGPGGTIAYTHRIFNNTGVNDTFDLVLGGTTAGWTSTIYADNNGDGVYTPGIDIAISNTLNLPDGGFQTFFVVVDAPGGAMPGDTDVTAISAISQNDPTLGDSASDTTTVIPATTHDLSGGDTLLVDGGDTAVFPGTIDNLQDTTDTFNFTITASAVNDAFLHPTEIYFDTNADGIPDTLVATDSDGDGTWDTVDPAFDSDMDGNPDTVLAGNGQLAYELRRAVDPLQTPYRDPVTLTATATSTGERDSITAVNLLAAPTHAVISAFRLAKAAGGTVVEWETALEIGTVGFYVERANGDGTYKRLQSEALTGLLRSPAGGTYRFLDTDRVEGPTAYRIVEVDVQGRERIYGPFTARLNRETTAPVGGFSATPRPAARPTQPLEAASLQQEGTPSGRLRLRVTEAGLYVVTAAELAAAWESDPTTIANLISSGGLRLFVEEPEAADPGCPTQTPGVSGIFRDGFESGSVCAWTGQAGLLDGIAYMPADDGSALYFFGEAIDSIYSSSNVYWIEQSQGRTMGYTAGGAPAPAPGGDFVDERHFEEEAYPLTASVNDPDGDFWFWEFFLAGDATLGKRIFSVASPGATAAAAELTVHLFGQTATDDVAPDHGVTMTVNGTAVGSTTWDGSAPHSWTVNVPAGILNDGNNTVEITAGLQPGVGFDIVYLDSFDLRYERRFQATEDTLLGYAGGQAVVTVDGFSTDDAVVFDLAAPRLPRRIEPITRSAGSPFAVSFAAPSWFLAQPLSTATPAIVEVDMASDLAAATNQADYVIIAGPGLEEAAADLADDRAGKGLQTMMVRVQDIYDEWNGGVASPWALRDFFEHALSTWQLPPAFVALAGDSSFDYKNIQGTGENLIPAPMALTPDGIFPSDHRTFDLTGNGVPEAAVGRIPARTNAELAAYVAKLQGYEAAAAGEWQRHSVWAADNVDEGGEFVLDSEALIDQLPSRISVERLFMDDMGESATRQGFLDAMNSGALWVNFLGHAGIDRLAGEGLIMTGDVAALANGDQLPVVTALTCSIGRFDFPGFSTLSETLVLHPGGGAAAFWAPTGLSFNAEALTIGNHFLAASNQEGQRLGVAITQALQAYLNGGGEDTHLPFVFTLLGDPAIPFDLQF